MRNIYHSSFPVLHLLSSTLSISALWMFHFFLILQSLGNLLPFIADSNVHNKTFFAWGENCWSWYSFFPSFQYKSLTKLCFTIMNSVDPILFLRKSKIILLIIIHVKNNQPLNFSSSSKILPLSRCNHHWWCTQSDFYFIIIKCFVYYSFFSRNSSVRKSNTVSIHLWVY